MELSILTRFKNLLFYSKNASPFYSIFRGYIFKNKVFNVKIKHKVLTHPVECALNWFQFRSTLFQLDKLYMLTKKKIIKPSRISKCWTKIDLGTYSVHGPIYKIVPIAIELIAKDIYGFIDYNNKIVLDIGGYIGDTAIYFISRGAKKVLVYEPVQENIKVIKVNVLINNLQDKIFIFPYAVTNKDGYIMVKFNETLGFTAGFGLNNEGKSEVNFNSISWNNVLRNAIRYKCDIVKVDCEGCEKYLLDVNHELIRKVNSWIIEVHEEEIGKKLKKLFKDLGYVCSHVKYIDLPISLILCTYS